MVITSDTIALLIASDQRLCHTASTLTVFSMITVQTLVNAPLQKVWDSWTKPERITKWCFASDDWEAPAAENDLRVDGRLSTTMAAKDKA